MTVLDRAGGYLISPARGTLVYVPTLFFVAYLLIRYRRHLILGRLVLLSLIVIAAHLFVISGFGHWWGGHSFGPRFTTGLVPWFVLLAVLGLRARLQWRERRSGGVAVESSQAGWRVESALGLALLLLSAFINTRGATALRYVVWNQNPHGVDDTQERLWDWRPTQFLAGCCPSRSRANFPWEKAASILRSS